MFWKNNCRVRTIVWLLQPHGIRQKYPPSCLFFSCVNKTDLVDFLPVSCDHILQGLAHVHSVQKTLLVICFWSIVNDQLLLKLRNWFRMFPYLDPLSSFWERHSKAAFPLKTVCVFLVHCVSTSQGSSDGLGRTGRSKLSMLSEICFPSSFTFKPAWLLLIETINMSTIVKWLWN